MNAARKRHLLLMYVALGLGIAAAAAYLIFNFANVPEPDRAIGPR
jgi:hypothetical protein